MTEFELIEQLINTQSRRRHDVPVSIGDDCAILNVPAGHQLAVSMDTLVAGVHFPDAVDAFSIGVKAATVNLSDLAASGAEPAWLTLSITMPVADQDWLKQFIKGVFSVANTYSVELVGGDTTTGPLSITLQAHGFVKKPLLRSAAKAGDLIFVSGNLGDAAIGLRHYQGENNIPETCIKKLNQPLPQIALGKILSTLANACIDISDGLISDLGHICHRSHCGAVISLTDLPLSIDYQTFHQQQVNDDAYWNDAIGFGDDYELCFTIAKANVAELKTQCEKQNIKITHIGKITDGDGISCLGADMKPVTVSTKGFEHFNE